MAQLADMAEQALLRGDSQGAARMLLAIRRQSKESAQLVDALLALARVCDVPMQRQPVDLGEMAREVEQALRAARGESVSAPVALAALPVVDADPALLRAVLTNLIGNALKFSERRAKDGRVNVYAETGIEGVTVHVADNGEGFDAASAARLFQPFQRLHGAAFDGHGVGLSIVRRAVERHGGRVWAKGEPGVGATFSFSLPQSAPPP
jgi:signal transduction histidine kinase